MTNQLDKMPREIWVSHDMDHGEYAAHTFDFSEASNFPAFKYVRADIVAPLVEAVRGLCFGTDWNNGTHAKIYRPKLIEALKQFESGE